MTQEVDKYKAHASYLMFFIKQNGYMTELEEWLENLLEDDDPEDQEHLESLLDMAQHQNNPNQELDKLSEGLGALGRKNDEAKS